ncbi:MAG TPA: hypothetical protein VFY03_13520 [Woeseiaceae bacterium]|nr:hypothetical protein [Woeseiaceae bacterium]
MKTEKWAAWAEISASVAVVVTLLFLVFEVRQNTLAIERQIRLERQGRLIKPYMESPEFREIYTAIKAKDGQEPRVAAFARHYSLSPEQAVYWVRHLDEIWTGLEADFLQNGPSPELDSMLFGMKSFADGRLYWEVAGAEEAMRFSPRFVEYVNAIRQPPQDRP